VKFTALSRFVLAGLAALQFVAVPVESAFARGRSVPIVRDAEIETLVAEYAKPILRAAGLGQSGIQVILVNDSSFNAFVTGRRIFVNTGALMDSRTPNQIIGVLAHEIGHIAGGHEQRLRERMKQAQTMAVVAALLGLGAGVAGAATNTGGLAQAGAGIAMGGGSMARRGFLSYQRTEEMTADRSALTYLRETGQSAKGMLETFRRFESALALSGVNVDPYEVSHPMPRDRIANLETLARQSPYFDRQDPPELQLRHDLMRAKIAAYTGDMSAVTKLFRQNPGGLPAHYADAINAFLHGNPHSALSKTDQLIQAQPGNPYFQELRGEVLTKLNRPREAAEAYEKAMRLDHGRSGLIQVGYGQALLATGQKQLVRKAAEQMKAGLSREPEYATGYRYLAQAYGQLGDIAAAELATAEGHYQSGDYRDARIFAARAQAKMKRGSPGWLRAQDIINYKSMDN
jgi:predicted Zn-dependent protease